jgi:hypothetical protein
MSLTLGKLIEQVAIGAGFEVLKQKATGGTTASIIDTSLANIVNDGQYNNYLFVVSKTTDGLAPQGQFGVVTSYASDTQTFTIPTLTAAVGAGDEYVIIKAKIKLYELIDRINRALGDLDPVQLVDTSLTTAESTLVYDVPVAIKGYNVQRIQIGSDTNGWRDYVDYDISPGAAGAVDKLVFRNQPPTADDYNTIKIWYLGGNPELSSYSDAVDERYIDTLAIAACVENVMVYLMDKKISSWSDKNSVAHLNDIRQRKALAEMQNPVRNRPAESPRKIGLRDA